MAQLRDKDLELINAQLRDLQLIKQDIDKAKSANVPGVDELEQRCNDCLSRCERFKQVYFPNKS